MTSTGPIIRINPYELHISDPDYYDVLYASSGSRTRRDKYEWSAKMFGNSGSTFSTAQHEPHRLRRAPLSPFFSRQSVPRLEPAIHAAISKLRTRFEVFRRSKEPVSLEHAYVALTTDIITEYAFTESYGYLDEQNFKPEWLRLQMEASELSLFRKPSPASLRFMMMLPDKYVERLKPDMMQFMRFRKVRRSSCWYCHSWTQHRVVVRACTTSILPIAVLQLDAYLTRYQASDKRIADAEAQNVETQISAITSGQNTSHKTATDASHDLS